MKKWCKIIELKTHDVLIQRLSDEENEEHILFTFKHDGVLVSFTASYGIKEKLADDMFNKYSKDDAQKMLDNTLKLFK